MQIYLLVTCGVLVLLAGVASWWRPEVVDRGWPRWAWRIGLGSGAAALLVAAGLGESGHTVGYLSAALGALALSARLRSSRRSTGASVTILTVSVLAAVVQGGPSELTLAPPLSMLWVIACAATGGCVALVVYAVASAGPRWRALAGVAALLTSVVAAWDGTFGIPVHVVAGGVRLWVARETGSALTPLTLIDPIAGAFVAVAALAGVVAVLAKERVRWLGPVRMLIALAACCWVLLAGLGPPMGAGVIRSGAGLLATEAVVPSAGDGRLDLTSLLPWMAAIALYVGLIAGERGQALVAQEADRLARRLDVQRALEVGALLTGGLWSLWDEAWGGFHAGVWPELFLLVGLAILATRVASPARAGHWLAGVSTCGLALLTAVLVGVL